MKSAAPVLAPVLRSDTQGRILALLFEAPDREWTITELASAAGTSEPTVHREIVRAVQAGIVRSHTVGQARRISADPTGRFYNELRRIVLGTFGPPSVVAQEFSTLPDVAAVVLFGSWVARYLGTPGRAPNDVDVLLVGDPNRRRVNEAAERAEAVLGMPVQTTIRSLNDWVAADPFLDEIRSRPMLVLAVDESVPALRDLVERMELGR